MTKTFENQKEREHMINAQGHLVPINMVKSVDKLEDDVVTSLYKDAKIQRSNLEHFKRVSFSEIQAFLDLISEKYGATKGGKKGNVTLTSYDGLQKVIVSIADYIQFGAQLEAARELIDECVREWSADSNDNIKAIINQAFIQGQGGTFNTQAILGLRKLDIKDPKWLRAMEAISDSIKVTSSKSYIRFYNRSDTESDWNAIALDIAKV